MREFNKKILISIFIILVILLSLSNVKASSFIDYTNYDYLYNYVTKTEAGLINLENKVLQDDRVISGDFYYFISWNTGDNCFNCYLIRKSAINQDLKLVFINWNGNGMEFCQLIYSDYDLVASGDAFLYFGRNGFGYDIEGCKAYSFAISADFDSNTKTFTFPFLTNYHGDVYRYCKNGEKKYIQKSSLGDNTGDNQGSNNSNIDFSEGGVFSWIGQFLQLIIDNIVKVIGFLNPLSSDFILKNIIKYLNPLSEDFILKSIIQYLNPFSEDFILKGILNFLGELLGYINPFSDNFIGHKFIELLSNLFERLFIPKQESFEKFSNIWNEKLSFVTTIKSAYNSIINIFNNLNAVPKFEINVDSKYFSGDLVVIDLSWYAPFKPYCDSVITAFIYVFFFYRLYKRLPSIISGSSSVNDVIQSHISSND